MLKEIKINNKCIMFNSNVKTEKRKLILPNVMCMRTQEAMNGIRGEKPMTQDVLVVTDRVNPREKKIGAILYASVYYNSKEHEHCCTSRS